MPSPTDARSRNPAPVKVRDAIYDLMRRFGMTYVFGNPGSTELPFFRTFPDDFRYVLGLQEAVVAGMADGYAQATRNASLVNLHSAAGVGNAMGNIFTAYKNHTPMVITAGQQARSILPFEPFLASAQSTELPRPYVKWSVEPARAEDVPLAFARAYYTAMMPPRGPVLVSIPADDWERPAELVPQRVVSRELRPDPHVIERIARAINHSHSPAIVVGAGVDRDDAWDEMVRLAESTNARVWAAPMSGRCGFPEDHALFAGFLPPMREKIVGLLHGHDVILVTGAPAFTYHVEGHGPHAPDGATICQLIDDPATAAWTPVGMAAVGGIRLALLDLLAHVVEKRRVRPSGRGPIPRVEPSTPMSVAYVLQTLQEVRDSKSIVVEEAPSARPVMQSHLPITRSEGFYTMDSGGLGWGMPAAVGIALAKPGEKIIALMGDGSSMYSIQALWSAAQWKLPITFIVLNNRRYAALREFAPVFAFSEDETVQGTELPNIDFAMLARAQGCEGLRVEDAFELKETLFRALQAPLPVLVEVEVA
jgi:benzoylformate decarboxylase